MVRVPQPYKVGPWDGGIFNASNPLDLTNRQLWDSSNVEITDKGKLRRRWDAEKVYSGTGVHSLYPGPMVDFFVEDDGLKALKKDDTAWTVTALTDVVSKMSFDHEVGRLFYSNGNDIGVCENFFASRTPVAYPIAWPEIAGSWSLEALSTGTCPAGTYLISLSYSGTDGRESPINELRKVVLSTAGAIHVSDIPNPASAEEVYIYVSAVNSGDQFLAATLPAGTTEWTFSSRPKQGRAPNTIGLMELPAGRIIRRHYGRTYVAVGNMLIWSHENDFGLTKLEDSAILYDADIDVLQSVEDGLWVVAGDTTYFLGGRDPVDFKTDSEYEFGATPGTGMTVHGNMFSDDAKLPEKLAFWFSDTGCIIGSTGGELKPLMEGKAADGKYQAGASFAVTRDGVTMVGAAVQGREESSGMKVSERVHVTIRRKNRRHGVHP